MKTNFTIFAIFFALIVSGQEKKPTIGIAASYITYKDTVIGYMQDRNLKDNYILDFGDGTKLFIDEEYKGNQFNHLYKSGGDYVVNFIALNKDASKEVLDTKMVSFKKDRNFLVIEKVTLKEYSPTKDYGAGWDNMFGNYLPDPYLEVISNVDKTVFISTYNNIFTDLKNNTDATWILNSLKIGPKTREAGISFLFYDSDTVTSNDYMGGVAFNNDKIINAVFKDDSGTVKTGTIKVNQCVFEITYRWE